MARKRTPKGEIPAKMEGEDKKSPGRPLKIPEPAEFERLADEYFREREESGLPITLTGCLRRMGIYSRATLDNYEKIEGFSEPVKKLRATVAEKYEERLHGNSPTGAIFALKNMGWTDTQVTEHHGPGGGPIQYENLTPEQRRARIDELERKRGNRTTSAPGTGTD